LRLLIGKILPIDLTEFQGKFISKALSLCSKGVSVGIEFSKKLGRGFFGGEGFIMQKKRTGICTLWRNLSKERTRTGEVLKVDTGCIGLH
jgi:uncharacterized protein (AIM24 family)